MYEGQVDDHLSTTPSLSLKLATFALVSLRVSPSRGVVKAVWASERVGAQLIQEYGRFF